MRAAGLARRLLTPITPGAKRSVVMLFVLTLVLAGANLLYSGHRSDVEQGRLIGDCGFYGDLAGVPITVAPPARKAAELGVKLVSDVRGAWHGQGCPGTIDPPSPSFVQWARYYRLPVN